MTTKVLCPSCGTPSYLDDLTRESDAFCRVCDFPLFWSRGERVVAGGDGGDAGLRRLPGTAGRVDVATIACPVCDEPNPIARTICIRCGADLRPAPPEPEPEPVPEPEPEPEPVVEEERSWAWLWVALAVAAAVAIVLLVLLLAF